VSGAGLFNQPTKSLGTACFRCKRLGTTAHHAPAGMPSATPALPAGPASAALIPRPHVSDVLHLLQLHPLLLGLAATPSTGSRTTTAARCWPWPPDAAAATCRLHTLLGSAWSAATTAAATSSSTTGTLTNLTTGSDTSVSEEHNDGEHSATTLQRTA